MLALIIILIILAAIMLIPLSVSAAYDGTLRASASVWFYSIALFPREKKPPDEKTEETAPPDEEKKPKKSFKLDFTLDEWLSLLEVALKALKRFKRGIYFGRLELHCVISAPDPYDAVMRYNAVNGIIGSLLPFFEGGFRVKDKDITAELDLNGGKSSAEYDISASLRVGVLLALALAAGFGALKIYIKSRIKRKRERTARNGKQQTERNDAVNDEQHQESC